MSGSKGSVGSARMTSCGRIAGSVIASGAVPAEEGAQSSDADQQEEQEDQASKFTIQVCMHRFSFSRNIFPLLQGICQ